MASGDMVALFADVPSMERVDELSRLLIPLAAARVLLQHFEPQKSELEMALAGALRCLKETVVGTYVHRWQLMPEQDQDPDLELVKLGGLSTPVEEEEGQSELEHRLLAVRKAASFDLVVLLDGLDRMAEPSTLAPVLAKGVLLLQRCGIGVVVAGPQQLRYRHLRALRDRFTNVHVHGAIDTADSSGARFLEQVLAQRSDDEMLPSASRARLVELSAGLIRDLVALARNAGEEAYAAGAQVITPEHVALAADRFGRGRIQGITSEMARRLTELSPRPGRPLELAFTPATDVDIELLLHGLLVELSSTPPRYVVHPTIEPLVPGLRKSA